MAQTLTYATTSSVYEVEGARVDVLISPTVEAYMRFWTSDNGESWTILKPGAVYTEPIEKTFDGASLGKYVKAEIYGGIGAVTLSASGRTIPPLVVDSAPTIAASDLWAGNTLTMTPAAFSGGTTPYTITNRWQMNTGDKWEKVGDGTTYTIPSGDQFYGNQLRAQSTCTDSSSLWDVPDNTIKSSSAAVTIVKEPVPPIVITTDCAISGTAEVANLLTAVAPAWTGGGNTSSVTSYEWLTEDTGGVLHTGTSHQVDANDVGHKIQLRATVSSTEESVQSLSTPTGQVPPQVTIGGTTVSVDGVAYSGPVSIQVGDTANLSVTYDGDAQPSMLNYGWSIQAGDGTINDADKKDATYVAPSDPSYMGAGSAKVICTLICPKASDTPQYTTEIEFQITPASPTEVTSLGK